VNEINMQDGIVGHYDFGLEHQQPEHLTEWAPTDCTHVFP
jgi:hypothetical protein